MTKTKSTKRALLSAVLALMLCIAMLAGTTYAWFTDSVTSGRNTIVSGNLDVELYHSDATVTDEEVTANTKLFDEVALWEPGAMVWEKLTVKNVGSLALKYTLAINVTDVTVVNGKSLTDVLKVAVLNEQPTRQNIAAAQLQPLSSFVLKSGASLAANTGAESFYVAIYWAPGANDNDYNIAGEQLRATLGVNLVATQDTVESDSFDEQYDKMATADSVAELEEALAGDADLIVLGADLELTDTLTIPAGRTVTIDLAGCTVSQKNVQTSAYAMIDNMGNLTIKDSVGTGKISYEDSTPYTNDPGWASNTISNKGMLTVNSGMVENLTSEAVMNYGYPHAIDVYQGSVTTINGGTVKSLNYDSIRMFCNSETLATKVVINGGTIVNRVSLQDPNGTRPGYGILEINGGNFVTTNGVTANVRMLNFCQNSNNAKATVTGGTFDKGFKTQDIAGSGIKTSDWLTYAGGIPVTSAEELQKEIDEFVDGTVLTFATNITGSVTVDEEKGKKVVIDGNGFKFDGQLNIDGKPNSAKTGSLLIKNVNFVTDDASAVMINNNFSDDRRYAHNITVEKCSFTATGAAKYTAKAFEFNAPENIQIKDCTATGLHSLLWSKGHTGTDAFVVDGVTMTDCKNGMSFGTNFKVVVKNCTIESVGNYSYGLRGDGNTAGAYTMTVENCKISADVPVMMRKMTAGTNYTLNIQGTQNEFVAGDSGYQIIGTSTEYAEDVAEVKPCAAGTFTLNGATGMTVFQ